MPGGTILQSGFFIELVLPFLLVFALVFAILEKTKLLGDGKRQINAIVALVIALIFVSFTSYVGLVINIIGIVAVVAVILLVFMLLYSFASSKGEFEMSKGLKITFGVLIAAALIIAILVFTGYWETIVAGVTGGNNTFTNILFVVIIAVAVIAVAWGGKKKD